MEKGAGRLEKDIRDMKSVGNRIGRRGRVVKELMSLESLPNKGREGISDKGKG